jgi:pimeloyl-ACP methyl ester carboxylesterase
MPTLDISAGRFEYLEQGRGEPVIFVHGSGSSSAQWRGLADQLSARYHVFAPDLIGYGGSTHWPGPEAFHLDAEAEIVRALVARAGGRAHLVAHSYGGAVALHVARTLGDSLRSLTLIEPAAFHLLRETDAPLAAALAEVAEHMVRTIASGEYLAGFEMFFDYWNGPHSWVQLPVEKRYAMAARLPKVALDFHAIFNARSRLADFSALTMPILLMQGACSPAPTRRICELLAHTIPDAELRTLDGAGHMAPITHREQVNAMIADQLDSISGHPSRRHAVAKNPSGRNTASVARSAA